MNQDRINEALANELTEAKAIVDTAIKNGDIAVLYKSYSIAKTLYKYLEEHLKENEPLAKTVDKWLNALAVYIQDNTKR